MQEFFHIFKKKYNLTYLQTVKQANSENKLCKDVKENVFPQNKKAFQKEN
ncbi:MAG: hypothetical protein IJ864_01390 [Alphaproteobacteria bacterium]|nr:hypothetical protein [Alphaproteobacteria bacterium]